MSPEDVLDLARRATTLVSPEDAETALAVLLDVWVETCTGTFLSRAGYDPELARQRNLAKVFVMCWDLLSKPNERPRYSLTSRNSKAALKPKDAWVCLPFDVRPSQREYMANLLGGPYIVDMYGDGKKVWVDPSGIVYRYLTLTESVSYRCATRQEAREFFGNKNS